MTELVPDNQYYDIVLINQADNSRITYGHIKYSYADLVRFLKPFDISVTDDGKQLIFKNNSYQDIKLLLFNTQVENKLELFLPSQQVEKTTYSVRFKSDDNNSKTIVFINHTQEDVILNI